MDETQTIYWKHISRNYLNPGYKRDLFTKPVPNLKQNGKNKKAFWELRNGELERSGKRSCGIQSQEYQELSAAAAAAPLITLKCSETQSVDLTDKGGVKSLLETFWASFCTTWHEQDRIFQIHVRRDIRRCTAPGIHVRVRAPHRNTTNSNGNQLFETFCSPQWGRIFFVRYECSGLESAPNITWSSKDRRQDTFSVDRRREMHGSLMRT